eukprot:2451723-Prymnesium_polylepis.1
MAESIASTLKSLIAKADALPDNEKKAALDQVKELQAKLTPKLESALPGLYSQYDKAGKHWYAPNKVSNPGAALSAHRGHACSRQYLLS